MTDHRRADQQKMRRALLRQIALARKDIAMLRRLYPHAVRWAVARLP